MLGLIGGDGAFRRARAGARRRTAPHPPVAGVRHDNRRERGGEVRVALHTKGWCQYAPDQGWLVRGAAALALLGCPRDVHRTSWASTLEGARQWVGGVSAL